MTNPMTSPDTATLTAEVVATRLLEADKPLLSSPISYIETRRRIRAAADMITALAAENATLRADYEDAFVRGMAHGQRAMPEGTFTVVDSPELATLRASEAAIPAQLADVTAELSACTEHPGGCGYWRDRCKLREAELTATNRRIPALTEALNNIQQLNMTGEDENGLKWAHSDLIEQEIVFARAALTTDKEPTT